MEFAGDGGGERSYGASSGGGGDCGNVNAHAEGVVAAEGILPYYDDTNLHPHALKEIKNIRTTREFYDNKSPVTFQAMRDMAQIYARDSFWRDAQRLQKQALGLLYKKTRGPLHTATIITIADLAQFIYFFRRSDTKKLDSYCFKL